MIAISIATDLYLTCPSSALGAPVALGTLEAPGLAADRELLRDEGVEHALVADVDAVELAVRSARRTLATEPSAPDAAVLCSDSLVEVERDGWADDLARSFGVPDLPIHVAGGLGCGNAGLGLVQARDLVARGATSVLLVTTDVAPADARYLPDERLLLSDAAASCVLRSTPPRTGFRVRSIAGLARWTGDSGSIQRTRIAVGAVKEVVAAALEGRPARSCRHLVMGNFAGSVRFLFAQAAGFPPDRARAVPCGPAGHCFGADELLGLRALVEREEVDSGDLLLVLSTSPTYWAATVLEYDG